LLAYSLTRLLARLLASYFFLLLIKEADRCAA
jgi:hypothetical protein